MAAICDDCLSPMMCVEPDMCVCPPGWNRSNCNEGMKAQQSVILFSMHNFDSIDLSFHMQQYRHYNMSDKTLYVFSLRL